MRLLLIVIASALAIAGCSFQPLIAPRASSVSPDVVQRGNGSSWVKFTPHTDGALGAGIVAGPDGNMWFIDENAAKLVRLGMGGAFKEFPMPGLGGNAIALTVGADNKFYVGNESSKILRVSTSGAVSAFTTPSGDNTQFGTLTLGPDGNVWFPETAHLGMITTAGKITEFPYPAGFSEPNQIGTITVGGDGNIWFGEFNDDAIVRFNITTHKFTEFKDPSTCSPVGLVKAKDDNVWFACLSLPNDVGKITKAGAITLFPGGDGYGAQETFQISTVGADGAPWFESGNNNVIFRINTSTGAVTTFSPPFQSSERPDSIASGPDGNLWVTTVGLDNVYVHVLKPMTLTPKSLTFTAAGQNQTFTVSESGTTSWTASSTNTAVATVAQGSPANTFKVTSAGVGTCKIKVSDAVGNSASVSVTVK